MIVPVLGLVGGAPAQGWGGDTARRRFIGGGRVPLPNSIPPSKAERLGDAASGRKILESGQPKLAAQSNAAVLRLRTRD